MRIMGKRQIGQLQPFELVIMVMLAGLAVIPMENTGVPLTNGLVPILTLLAAEYIASFLSLKSEEIRKILCGKPSILINRGKIVEQELQRLRINLNDLLEQLRIKNMPNISEVEFAILETSGSLSVIPKSQKRPLTPNDLNIPTNYEGLPITLILDGKVNHENLRIAHLSIEWLKEQISENGYSDFKEILFAALDTSGNIFIQEKMKHHSPEALK
jgi:uncharacterized membrane protein YcaP (DUF421 family)